MMWVEWAHGMLIPVLIWFLYLWLTQPKYEDGKYVSAIDRIRKASKRVFCRRNKQRADDP